MNRKALILAWSHPSNTVLSLASSLAHGLTANDVEVTTLNINDPQHLRKLGTFGRLDFDQVFFLGSVPLQIKYNGMPPYEYFKARCYFWVFDPIMYDLVRVPATWDYFQTARNSDRLYFLFPDRSYMETVQRIVGDRTVYFPFAGDFDRPIDLQDRNLARPIACSDVLVLANVGQELSEFASKSLQEIVGLLDPFGLDERRKISLVDHVMNDELHSNVALSVSHLMQLSSEESFRVPTMKFIAALDASEKRRRRLRTIDAVRSVKMDIIGSGWQELMGTRPNITYRPSIIRHEFLPNLFARYKVLLDFSPNWDHGFNDRVVSSLGAGCRVVTSRNLAVEELTRAATLVSTYSPHHPAPESEVEKALNASPVDEHLISHIAKKHSWSTRIRQLLS